MCFDININLYIFLFFIKHSLKHVDLFVEFQRNKFVLFFSSELLECSTVAVDILNCSLEYARVHSNYCVCESKPPDDLVLFREKSVVKGKEGILGWKEKRFVFAKY